uniref:Uncharacterized protein n=1 Tax=Panagrolaimus sp. ES5 TaxID=591445 RepID=A0AC34FVZ1_9BILA
MEDEKNYPSLELIFGKEKHSLIYEVNKIEYLGKIALRPTVFLALMPLFSFEKTAVNIISNEYPSYIHVEKFDYKRDEIRLCRKPNSDFENIDSNIDACMSGDDYENLWSCDSDATTLQENFLSSTKNYIMGYES